MEQEIPDKTNGVRLLETSLKMMIFEHIGGNIDQCTYERVDMGYVSTIMGQTAKIKEMVIQEMGKKGELV